MIYDLAFAPSNPNIVYMLNDTTAVWKSTDGGGTWTTKRSGFFAYGGSSIAISPFDENLVLATAGHMSNPTTDTGVQGLFRTTDGGARWSQVASHWMPRPNHERGGDLIAFSGRNTVYLGTADQGVLRSTDAGLTWKQIATPAQLGASSTEILEVKAPRLTPDGQYPKTLFVVTMNPAAPLQRVVDNGASTTVSVIGSGLPPRVNAIAIPSGNQNVIYAAAREQGVYKSTDGGATFLAKNSGVSYGSGYRASYISVSPADDNYVFISASGHRYYYSHNGGDTWAAPSLDEQNAEGWVAGSLTEHYPERAIVPDWLSGPVAVHPLDRNVSLMIAEHHHIMKSTNGGLSYRYSNSGYSGGCLGYDARMSGMTTISWDPNNPQRFAFFLIDTGVFITEDGGATFRNLRPPRHSALTTKSGALDPTPGAQRIITAVGEWGVQTIVVTTNADSPRPTWTAPAAGTDGDYQFIAFHPQTPNVVFAGGLKSTNRGSTWSPLPRQIVGLFPKNGDIVYSTSPAPVDSACARAYSPGCTRILRSSDQGATWTNRVWDLPASTTSVGQVTVDPENADRLYVAVLHQGVYLIDGTSIALKNQAHGLTKAPSNNSLHMRYVTVDPKNTKVLYAAQRTIGAVGNGVFRSIDGGQTWVNIMQGHPGPEFTAWSLNVNPHTRELYVGSMVGTWKFPPP